MSLNLSLFESIANPGIYVNDGYMIGWMDDEVLNMKDSQGKTNSCQHDKQKFAVPALAK